MTPEEKKAEALKDFGLMRTKIDMAYDSFNKRTKTGILLSTIQKVTITTKSKNTWTITFVVAIYGGVVIFAHAPVHGHIKNGYIAISGTESPIVMEYTAHFIQRYNERYLIPNNINTRGLTAVEYYMIYNANSATHKTEDGFCMISNHGYTVGSMPIEKMIVHVTFIDNETLTNKKSSIYDKKIYNVKALYELFNYAEVTPKIISMIASKYNADEEVLKKEFKL